MAAILQLPVPYGASADDWLHFDLVLGLTADLLPVVSNPNAVISEHSSMKAVGKTPSRYNGSHHAVGFADWTRHTASAQEVAGWSRERDYGISLQTRRVRALDVDVTDASLAAQIREFIAERFALPTRTRSTSSKFLVVFECPGELYKKSFKCEHGIVEWLCGGQQFIAAGSHVDKDGVSRSRYEWASGLPDAIPVLTMAQAEALWEQLAARFAIEQPSESQASVKGHKLAEVISSDPVAQFLLSTNRVKRTERDGRMHIVCPFEIDHTTDTGDSSSTYFPAHTGGYVNGHFQCLHAHCDQRSDQEFLDALDYTNPDLASEFSAIAQGDHPHPTAPADGAVDSAGTAQEHPEPKAGARFAFHPAHEFALGKPAPWMVKGVLPQAQLGVIFGESGSGKTFEALDLAVAVATGSPWRDRPTRKGQVAYIVAEGAGGFRSRLKAIAQVRGVGLDAIPLVVLADAPNLMEKQDALDVARAIVAAGGAQLVVVDTFAQVMPGANENAGEDVGRALAHCKGIHRATGAMVLLVHHSGKDASRGARGWSGLRAAADVELEVVRADEARSLTVTKMKDGEDGAEFGFRLETIVVGLDEDGAEITSCVVRHTEGGAPVRALAAAQGPKGSVERVILAALEEMVGVSGDGVFVAELVNAACAQLPHDDGAGKRDRRNFRAHRALEGLIAAGRVRIADGRAVLV